MIYGILVLMPLFAVVALKDSAESVDAAVTSLYPDSSYKLESGKWVVRAALITAKQLSQRLGLRETHSHIVFAVRGYSGRAQTDAWEWMAAQSEKSDG